MAQAIQQSVYEQTHPKPPALPAPEQQGPLKAILAHQESLYKYVSWEDPFRTLGSYIALVSLLVGAHYMPLTRWALKAGAYTSGAIWVAEFASRSFGRDTFLSRLRPKPYKKVPEPVLDATLKDIHDFIQYCAVQSQRVLYGEDLKKTFAIFLGFTTMYWLIGAASPFALSLLGLTSLYIAPLVLSPQSREIASAVAHDGASRAKDLANAAADSGKSVIDSGKATVDSGINMASNNMTHVAEQAAKTRDAVVDMSTRAGSVAVDSGKTAIDSTKSLAQSTTAQTVEQSSKARNTIADASTRAAGTTADAGRTAMTRAAEQSDSARDTVTNMSTQAGTTVSNLFGTNTQSARDNSNQVKAGAEQDPNYVVDRKARTIGGSSIPRAGLSTFTESASYPEGRNVTEKVKI
jgi:hypothetical protein